MVMLGLDLSPQIHLRLGAYDDLAYVIGSTYFANQLVPIAMLQVDAPTEHVRSVLPFVRGGYYADGRRAGGFTFLLGVMADYE